jgi:hypothetical protein
MAADTPSWFASASRAAAREPLVQFLAVALILFLANSLIHGSPQRVAEDGIAISEGRVLQIAESYRLLSGRMPSRAELHALVNDFIDEEIGYREAVALGLDADDTIVRRRMRQKLEFLAEDADASEAPSEQQLLAHLQSHSAVYRLPGRVALRQILASADARGATATADATAFLDELSSGADAGKLGDASMLPQTLPLSTQRDIAMLFGEAFAADVFKHHGEGWFGPVGSPFGAHAVQIVAREPARDPALGEVRDKLSSDWIEARRMAMRAEFQANLRERYRIRVDWPEPYTSQPAPADIVPVERPLDTIDTHGE